MFEKKMDVRMNGASEFATTRDLGTVRLWRRVQLNEWTFSFFLFVVSLSIVLGKLCVNYGSILQLQNSARHATPSLSMFSVMPDPSEYGVKKIVAASEKFVNVSSRYEEALACAVSTFYGRYGWLIRAAISGLVMMGFTWFIIYKDSSIPGVNPPSPFSPSKRRVPDVSRVQMNYLVGVLNGMLIFVYMCL